ncbi:hypothetical protein [Longimicrobium sp.]|uniref:hypothetical protein n=1 Tax=Longimicrobium sp. TaxID=2029185 RepID=UPI003B3BA295
MHRRTTLLVVLATLNGVSLAAQPTSGGAAATPALPPAPTAPAAQEEEENDSPFDFSFGPQEDGSVGAVLKGSEFYPLGGRIVNIGLISPFVGLEVDAGWNNDPDALGNASFSLKPAFTLSSLTQHNGAPNTTGPWLYVFADGRARFGRFKEEGEEEPGEVNQMMLGGGAQFRWTTADGIYAWLPKKRRPTQLLEPPSLTFTYYTVQSTKADNDAILPDGVTADVVQATLRSELIIPLLGCTTRNVPPPKDAGPFPGGGWTTTCPFTLDARLTATQPTTGDGEAEFLADVGIVFESGGKLKPVVRYRSGAEHGLEYDRQLLLGVLWEFVK